MSLMGQRRTWRDQIAMSALPLKADIQKPQIAALELHQAGNSQS
jgi:hypothetical protein